MFCPTPFATMFSATFALFPLASGHGYMTYPPSRANGTYEIAAITDHGGCDWGSFGVHIPGEITLVDPLLLTALKTIADPTNPTALGADTKNPWRSPGTAPVRSPCGNNIFHRDLDALDLPPNADKVTWAAGSVVEVASAVFVNHGGGWSYRLCPKSSEITEECFQKHPLPFVGDSAVTHFTDGREIAIPSRHTKDKLWSRNQIPAHHQGHDDPTLDFDMPSTMTGQAVESWDYSIKEEVSLPADLAPGEYFLQWRWDAEIEPQVWLSCADVTIEA